MREWTKERIMKEERKAEKFRATSDSEIYSHFLQLETKSNIPSSQFQGLRFIFINILQNNVYGVRYWFIVEPFSKGYLIHKAPGPRIRVYMQGWDRDFRAYLWYKSRIYVLDFELQIIFWVMSMQVISYWILRQCI